MDREMKFRSWSTNTKSMGSHWNACHVLKDDPSSVQDRQTFNHTEPYEQIVMQYTGLKDKNGTDICEGDIIKASSSINDEQILEVYWNPAFAQFSTRDSDGGDAGGFNYWVSYSCSEIEVIGNIHENPELFNE